METKRARHSGRRLALVALPLAIAFVFTGAAKKPIRSGETKSGRSLPVTQSIDPGMTQVAAWHSPEAIWDLLDLDLRKGEFETSDQFSDRMKLREVAVAEMVAKGHRFGIPLDVDDSALRLEYDADQQSMKVQLDGKPIDQEGESRELGVMCPAISVHPLGSYEAENAFGKKVTVSKVYSTSYCIATTMPGTWRFTDEIPVPIGEARSAKSRLRGALLFPPGRILTKRTFLKATIDRPLEGVAAVKTLVTTPVDLAIFDAQTKRVLKVFRISEAPK